jgi:hypothetical protein
MNMPCTGPVIHEIQARRLGRRTSADGGNLVTSINLPRSAGLRGLRRAPGIACGFWLLCLDVQAIQPAGYHGIGAPLRAAILLAAFSFKENAGKDSMGFG